MKKIFVLFVCSLLLFGCGKGGAPVTEVLNPSQSPQTVKYVGVYKSVVFSQEQQNLFSDVSFKNIALKCKANEILEKSIEEGADDSTIHFINLFSYDGVVNSIAAALDRLTGLTHFDPTGDAQNKINCTGQFVLDSDQKVLLALDCNVAGVQPEDCMVTAKNEGP